MSVTFGKPRAVAAGKVLFPVAVLLVLAGCPNMISMDELLASIGGDITAVGAKVVVSQGATALPSGTGQYPFGSVVADGMVGNFAGNAITFTITNSGGAKSSFTVDSVTLSGTDASDFVLPAFVPTTLAYNDTASFTLTFDPDTVGGKTATVTIGSTGSDTPTYTFSVTGTGDPFSISSVPVPGGSSFVMGWTDIPASAVTHTVTSITGFDMSTYEITWDTWSKVKAWATAVGGYVFANAGQAGEGNHAATAQEPVTRINWRDAIVWCNAASQLGGLIPAYYVDSNWAMTPVIYKDATVTTAGTISDSSVSATDTNACVNWGATGYRLPTEAEWEYAARYTGTGTSSQGDRASGDTSTGAIVPATTQSVAWYADGTNSTTHAVGTRLPNTLSIYDMTGNVEEWVWDWYVADISTYTGTDPMGPVSSSVGGSAVRVHRGGAWDMIASLQATSYHQSHFLSPGLTTDSSNYYIGFRVVSRP